jgi:hypothetical protein
MGIAIASSVAAAHTGTLLRAGHAAPVALTGGFQQAFWVLGVIALLAVLAISLLVRHRQQPGPLDRQAIGEPQPALAAAN